ncbi:hypothetical protein ABW20_dc0103825 [Dactylellina cionopaga]|nr:hypothetical protein ABW20_dc0103825 [Dactylellina cionopaga]
MRCTGRLKGKERKQARDAAVQDRAESGPSSPHPESKPKKTYKITIQEFKILAEYIANCPSPKSLIPKNFFDILNRAIKTRREHLSKFIELCQDDCHRHGNETHDFFISVLEHVRDILTPKQESAPNKKASSSFPVGNADKINKLLETCTNKFNVLNVQEPLETFSTTSNVSTSQNACTQSQRSKENARGSLTNPKVYEPEEVYSIDLGDDRTEQHYAVFLFMLDLFGMRHYLRGVWQDYKNEKIPTPIPAAVTTNTAIHLVRCLEAELRADFPNIKDFRSIAADLYIYSTHLNCFWESEEQNMIWKEYKSRNRSKSEWCMLPCFTLMQDFCTRSLHRLRGFDGFEMSHEPGGMLDDDLKEIFRGISAEDKYPLESWICILFMAGLMPPMEGDDEVAKAAREIHKTRTLPIWTIFAMQTFADTKLELGDADPAKCFALHIGCYPLRAGIRLLVLKSYMQECGLNFANISGSIMYACHLYNAVRNECHMRSTWDDLELFIPYYLKNGLFIGNPPQSRIDYMKQFDLSTGMSARNFAQNRRSCRDNHRVVLYWKSPKMLKEFLSIPVTEIFIKQLRDDATMLPYDGKVLHQWILKILETESLQYHGHRITS